MNRLAYHRGYLCGPIERMPRPEEAGTWRRRVRAFLRNRNIYPMCPLQKPTQVCVEGPEFLSELAIARAAGDLLAIQAAVKPIRGVDLRMLDVSDFAIVHLDLDIHSTGTYEEFFWGNRCKKPMLTWIRQGRMQCPSWVVACIPTEHIFSTLDEVLAYVAFVDESPTEPETYGRWRFFDYKSIEDGHDNEDD